MFFMYVVLDTTTYYATLRNTGKNWTAKKCPPLWCDGGCFNNAVSIWHYGFI